CLFSIEHPKRRRFLDAGAGICAGMAIHSNVLAVAVLSIFFASYTVLWWCWRRGITTILGRLLVIAAGVAVVSALGVAYYWSRTGRADIFSITLRLVSELAG